MSTDLLSIEPRWVTLRTTVDEGLPVVVLVDEAVGATAPYELFTTQVAVAVQLAETPDGQPAAADQPSLRQLEQRLVDAGVGEARLVAVLTLEGTREWVFYARSSAWAQPFADSRISVQVSSDPTWHGLAELRGQV